MMLTFQFSCPTPGDTKALARAIGAACQGGEIIAFASDLGGGKTTFVKGLATGLGVTDIIQSPTFTISQIHKAGRGLELHHFDFYRLNDPGIMRAELAESVAQPNAVVAIEWGGIVHDTIPKNHMAVTLSVGARDARVVSLDVPKRYEHIRAALAAHTKGDRSAL